MPLTVSKLTVLKQTAPKLMAAAVLTGALALMTAPARSADTVSPNDTAHFLAGMAPASDSPLAALANMPAFTQQQHAFDSIFEQEDKNTLSKVRAFSAAHLSHSHDTMLYMFSGPDFLYASSFFPHASTYVMAGLEPVGQALLASQFISKGLDAGLRQAKAPHGLDAVDRKLGRAARRGRIAHVHARHLHSSAQGHSGTFRGPRVRPLWFRGWL